MSGETGTGEGYRTEMNVRDAAWHPLGRLEEVLEQCKPGIVVHQAHDDGHYVAFRRKGCVYAVRLEAVPGFASASSSRFRALGREDGKRVGGKAREEMDRLVMEINEGVYEHSIVRGTNTGNTCLGHADFAPRSQSGAEYELPEGTRFVRRAKRRIIFYSGIPPEAKRDNGKPMPKRRRDYFVVPDSAEKVKCSGSEYEWLVSGEWVKITKKAE